MNSSKRSYLSKSDMNNNEIVSNSSKSPKKKKLINNCTDKQSYKIGQIKEICMLNFMCHKNFSIDFHSTPMQIITGANGSGKSTIANAICLCLGAQARTTGRTSNVQSFIQKGETFAELKITLANEGPEAYKPELYGKEIHITRRIGIKQSSYKVLSDNNKIISRHKETIAEIIQALSISPENPLCILHQEIAKTFLLNNDGKKKYQFYMKVSQLDQIKQAYEDAVCTVQSIDQRINGMKQRHIEMFRTVELFEREVKKIENRRDQEKKKHLIEAELIQARNFEAQQELINVQNELDQTQKIKDIIETRMTETHNQIHESEQKIENYTKEKSDIEKDLLDTNGLRELNFQFSKTKKEIELTIYRLSHECQKYHEKLKELEEEESLLKKQINEFRSSSQQSNHTEQQRIKLDQELQTCQQQQIEWDRIMSSFTEDINIKNENIKKQQSTIVSIQNEMKQKQQDLEELFKIEKDKTSVYGIWMTDCLKAIENDNRFRQKPIGPIGRYVHCINPHWSYAVEKHLAAIMPAFICSSNHDESILLELFSYYCTHTNQRPVIYVRKYSKEVPDISGTLGHIRRANLLSIYQVLKIDNITVECALIDYRQIEATILLDDLQHAKRIRQSGILQWRTVYQKIKQVGEAWTYDGSNVKLDKAFRIYTNDRQPARFFTSNNTQALSINELNIEIKRLNEQINEIKLSIDTLKKEQQTTTDKLEKIKRSIMENTKKIKELNKELEKMNSTMPTPDVYSLDELKEKLNECTIAHNDISQKFEEVKENKENKHQDLANVTEKLENIVKKVDAKTRERETLIENIDEEKSECQQIQQQIPRLLKKSAQLNEDIQRCQERINELTKNQPKKSKTSKSIKRSVRDIQQELDGINNFLKSNEDTIEKRRQTIEEYKIKRDHAQALKKTYEQCSRQLQCLSTFVNKRKERFGRIADQHEYLLRHKFQNLMSKHQFDDCDIKVDHKKEELQIIIKQNQRSVASLSGGERSISTFCFLLALWGSIYQPFRFLDEIDIYMDNEKRNSSLELLYENTQFYSSSQHVILTPQSIDPEVWKKWHVPVFCMPTPKRSLQ